MRLLHTADWHLGKTLEGRSRHQEQEQFLDELYNIVEAESVDVVLMAGDVYDTVNPPAASEQLFYDALARLADYGKRQVIIISGNHDHPDRLAAASPIALKHGMRFAALPTKKTMTLHIESRGETLQVAALPYPSESRLKALLTDSLEEEMVQKAYQEKVKFLLDSLCRPFTNDTVNIVMSHVFVAGGRESDSERPIQVGGAYTIDSSLFPDTAQYVALGHLHRSQTIKSAKTPIRYAGSPLAYSFSEAGQAKSVTLVDVSPGQPARVEEIMLSSGKPLVEWKASSLAEIYQRLDEGVDKNSWLNIEVEVDETISIEEIHRLREMHHGIVHIRPLYKTHAEEKKAAALSQLPIDELFRRFFERQTGGAKPDEELVQLFFEMIDEEETEPMLEKV